MSARARPGAFALAAALHACAVAGAGGADRSERGRAPSPGEVPATGDPIGVAGVGGSLVGEPGEGPDGASLGRPSIGSTPLPCALDAVLETSCRGCHAREPGFQAPMALVTHEDLMAPAVSDPSRPVHALLTERVHSDAAPMPPLGSGRRLTEDEFEAVDGWIAGGTVAGADACGALPAATTGITYEPPGPEEIDQCYRFVSHANAVPGDATPFQAGPGEFYACFFFDVPWEGEKQAILFRSIDTPRTHHWLLYDTPEPAADGAVLPVCLGSHPGAPDLLAAWALGQQKEQFMPKEAGLRLPVRGSGRKFLVEVHYSNPGAPVADESGVEVCTGKAPRPNTAAVSWLGTEAIAILPGQKVDLSGTCTPPFAGEITVFRAFPHMHARGYHLKTVIQRAGGATEMLVDEPFDFNRQVTYDTPAVIGPDDVLVTTCSYQNNTDRLLGIGYDSASEMCFNFLYAWPAGVLVSGISLTGASTPCLL